MSDVGTGILFENDDVVVWCLELQPGEQGPVHTHERDYVVRVLNGSTVEVRDAADQVLYCVETYTGEVVHFRMDGDSIVSDRKDAVPIPATHSARNVGEEPFRELLVEFKT